MPSNRKHYIRNNDENHGSAIRARSARIEKRKQNLGKRERTGDLKKPKHWANQMNTFNLAVCRKEKKKEQIYVQEKG
jgi:hypothetical protein